MNKIFWIGPRESDIVSIKNIFFGSVTIYGSNTGSNIAYCDEEKRINHNIENQSVHFFIEKALLKTISKYSDVKFLFYDQDYIVKYDQRIIKHCIGIIPQSIINVFSDKHQARSMFKESLNIIPYIEAPGSIINYDFLSNCFETQEFVVQKKHSAGGEGTYFINSSNKEYFIPQNIEKYIVSPYIRNAIPVNTHVFITHDSFYIFPSSIQICEINSGKILYYGADYISFKMFFNERAEEIISSAKIICKILQKFGYFGIAGIDWMISQDKIYFVEINTRFQASSELLNRALVNQGFISLQEMQIKLFEGINQFTLPNNLFVSYSNFVFTNENSSYEHIDIVSNSSEIIEIQSDGFNYQNKNILFDQPYLCRAVFDKNISSIINEKLVIHPNMKILDLEEVCVQYEVPFITVIKIILINHGVRISEVALDFMYKKGIILPAVFDAVDIKIFDEIYVNAPYKCTFSSISPMSIELRNSKTILCFDGQYICDASVALLPQPLIGAKTQSGVPFSSIMQLATDRVRINPAPVCIYKKTHRECAFCNLPNQNYFYEKNDIFEVIDRCIQVLDFRHFLIGGGTICEDDNWNLIIDICRYIRSKSNKEIYLMSIPSYNIDILKELKDAGVTEIAFNLEVFDRDLAKKIMPGKGNISLDVYIKAFKEAVRLWGKHGAVRSLIIYGLENDDIFLEGLEKLCSMGVEPIISAFRPLAGTIMQDYMPPKTQDIICMYKKASKIAEKFGLILGPDCIPCRNNTISSPY